MNKLLTNSQKSSIGEEIKKIIKAERIKSVKILSPYISYNHLLSFMIDENISIELICDLSKKNILSKGIDISTVKIIAEQSNTKIWSNDNLHSKVIILEDRFCLIGSANFTFYGLEARIETMLLTDEKEVIGESLKLFNELKNKEILNDFILNIPHDSKTINGNLESAGTYIEHNLPEDEEESDEKYGKLLKKYEEINPYPKIKRIEFINLAEMEEEWEQILLNTENKTREEVKKSKTEIIKKILITTGGYIPTKNYKSNPKFGEAVYQFCCRSLKEINIEIKGTIAEYITEKKIEALKDYVNDYGIEPKTGDYNRFLEYFEKNEKYKKEYEEIKKSFRVVYSEFRKEYYLNVLKRNINEIEKFKEVERRYPSNQIRASAIRNPEKKNEKKYYIESRLASFLDIKKRKWDNLPEEHRKLLKDNFPDYFSKKK